MTRITIETLHAFISAALDWQIIPANYAAVVGYSVSEEDEPCAVTFNWDGYGDERGLEWDLEIDDTCVIELSEDRLNLVVTEANGCKTSFNLVANIPWPFDEVTPSYHG